MLRLSHQYGENSTCVPIEKVASWKVVPVDTGEAAEGEWYKARIPSSPTRIIVNMVEEAGCSPEEFASRSQRTSGKGKKEEEEEESRGVRSA